MKPVLENSHKGQKISSNNKAVIFLSLLFLGLIGVKSTLDFRKNNPDFFVSNKHSENLFSSLPQEEQSGVILFCKEAQKLSGIVESFEMVQFPAVGMPGVVLAATQKSPITDFCKELLASNNY